MLVIMNIIFTTIFIVLNITTTFSSITILIFLKKPYLGTPVVPFFLSYFGVSFILKVIPGNLAIKCLPLLIKKYVPCGCVNLLPACQMPRFRLDPPQGWWKLYEL